MIAFDANITASPEVIFSPVEEQIVLLNTGNDRTYGLDGVASYVWQCAQGLGATPDVIAAKIVDRYDVEESVARADLQRLLSYLSQQGLILVD